MHSCFYHQFLYIAPDATVRTYRSSWSLPLRFTIQIETVLAILLRIVRTLEQDPRAAFFFFVIIDCSVCERESNAQRLGTITRKKS